MRQMTEPGNPPTAAPDEPMHWLVKPGTIRALWIVFGVILAGMAAGDFFVHHYEYFGIDGTFAFYAWYGFVTCVGMVVGAKVLGIFLKRPDDYYEEEGTSEDAGGTAAQASAGDDGNPTVEGRG